MAAVAAAAEAEAAAAAEAAIDTLSQATCPALPFYIWSIFEGAARS